MCINVKKNHVTGQATVHHLAMYVDACSATFELGASTYVIMAIMALLVLSRDCVSLSSTLNSE